MTEEPGKIKNLANKVAADLDADVLLYNFEILPGLDFRLVSSVAQRKPRRKNVILILITEGGQADSAFRMMRALQSTYERVTIVIPGWCKSAGTLMCIGAHELQMGVMGEMGPLDVQIVKADEMDEQKSGLVAEAAFEKLQQEAFKFFMGFVRDLGASEYRVTLKTAFDIATRMTAGVVQPIFDKLEPVTFGEDFRSNRLAQAYAERLNQHSKNLKKAHDLDALDALLSGYPAHGFVIDIKEASDLFRNVKPISDQIVELMMTVGIDCFYPRSRRQDQSPKMEYLNDAPDQPNQGEKPADGAGGDDGPAPRRRARRVPRNPEAGSSKATRRSNGAKPGTPA